jgi:CBS domain containing-hemolysin-like protein
VDIGAIELEYTHDQILEIFKNDKFSRLPVYKESIDHIVGVLNFRDFMLSDIPKEEFKAQFIMRKPFFTYEYQTTAKLFSQMKAEGAGMTIILDEYGGTAGLITLEDLIETIVGEIFDEYDDEEKEEKQTEIICVKEGEEYIVLGSVRIEDFNELLELDLTSDDYDTMAGYAMDLFGYIPTLGEEITSKNITFAVEAVEKNRIESLRIKINKIVDEEKPAEETNEE